MLIAQFACAHVTRRLFLVPFDGMRKVGFRMVLNADCTICMRPRDAQAFSRAIRRHGSLRTLELGYNPLGAQGAQHIVDVAKFDLKVWLR